jgi:hypothetical protein
MERHEKLEARRGWLKAGTLFLGASLIGCQNPNQEIAVGPDVKPSEDQGYRMYAIISKDGLYPWSEITKLGVEPAWVRFHRSRTTTDQPEFQYVIWALPEQIESIGEIDGLEIVEMLPEHVLEIGDAAMDGGLMAVKCLPNSETGKWQGRPCATPEQIAAEWRDHFKSDEITFTVVSKSASRPKPSEEFVEPDQIIIRFSSPELKQKIRELVKEHPQTLMLQWGKPFTHIPDPCPGCGMG